jgi:hypothetical protein
MTDKNPARVSDHDLDRLLDAALKKYSSVEPRRGLEDRVLANLRVEQKTAPARTWWRWGLAVLTAIVVVAIALAFRSEKPPKPHVVQQAPAPARTPDAPETQIASHEAKAPSMRPVRPRTIGRRVAAARATPVPKLDQFPSPQPLSEEETILAGYIKQDPQHAALLAEARMDSLRRDAEERVRIERKDQRNTQ